MLSDFFAFCFFMVVLVVVSCVLGNISGAYTCNNYQDMTGITTKWVAVDACYVKTEKGWQRWDEYKARAIASELKD